MNVTADIAESIKELAEHLVNKMENDPTLKTQPEDTTSGSDDSSNKDQAAQKAADPINTGSESNNSTQDFQKNNANQKENIAKTAEAGVVTGDNMEDKEKEIKEEACDSTACGKKDKVEKKADESADITTAEGDTTAAATPEVTAAAGDESGKESEGIDLKDEKPAEEDTEKDNPFGGKEEKKKEIKEKDFKEAEKLLNKVLANETAEAAEGEDESEDIKNIKEAVKLLGMKEDKKPGEFDSAEDGKEFSAELDISETPVSDEQEPKGESFPIAGASLVARFQKKASLADSTWFIKDAKTNEDFVSFDVKAAFGKNIDNDPIRAKYASSKEFGRAVMASLVDNKVNSALGVQSAVLQVVAHYTPCYPSAAMFKANTKSTFPKASGAGDTATDASILPAKVAAAAPALEKKAAAAEAATIPTDAKVLPGACSVKEKVNTNVEESATPANNTKVESETDKKIVASYESKLKALAEENNRLKIEAQLQEKTAIAKDCITLMVKAGLLRANEQVRIAALKDGLSVEAANAKAIAASINEQTKCLLGMPTAQLNAYKQSIAHLQPAVAKTASVDLPVMQVKASVADTVDQEEKRLLSVLEWD